ncbi:MAG: glycoside hydrolase family 16 protein [Spirochaetaceae bacterium]|jgi:hypothetical protein|nr:glycoside hydrolase family 16 protein [Spirochaetaceae bacterium]
MRVCLVIIAVLLAGNVSAQEPRAKSEKQKDLRLSRYAYPDLNDPGKWTPTMNVDFAEIRTMDALHKAGWFPSKHGLRNYEYWCPDMIEFRPGEGLVIHSVRTDAHVCSLGVCPAEGVFTGGIETRQETPDGYINAFEQAYGFFEAEVQVPIGGGMWSAFWLQCDGTAKRGKQGKDGSEIDIYESSFQENPANAGHAIHYDAYQSPWYRVYGKIVTLPYSLYEGYHRYALLWTPTEYVFFIDGAPTWATAFGGVSQVKEILRLTVEVREGPYGPYGQRIGSFGNRNDRGNDFAIKSVKVWQFSAELKTSP